MDRWAARELYWTIMPELPEAEIIVHQPRWRIIGVIIASVPVLWLYAVVDASSQNQEYLQVYGRTNQPCFACGAPIEKLRVSGRSAHYCPCCQKQ